MRRKMMTPEKLKELEKSLPVAKHPLTGEPDHWLFTARLFCSDAQCKHYNNECSDGNEHVWVACPRVIEHEIAMRTILKKFELELEDKAGQ
jgi:hypothetical protein